MLLACCSAMAQDTASVLPKVNIASSRLLQKIGSAMPVQQLNAQTLSTLTSVSVADAVKYLPGVLVKDYGGLGGLKTVSVRSLGASHTGVFTTTPH